MAADMHSFPQISLRVINRLIPALFSSYNEIDLRTCGARISYEPEEVARRGDVYKPILDRHIGQHPLMQRYARGEDDGVWMISDFLSESELHGRATYREALGPMGIEDTLSFTLRGAEQLKVFIAVNGSRRFSERDRAMAAALQPHLTQAFENAIAFTRSRALTLLSARTLNAGGEFGVLLVDASGNVAHASERATEHLAALFPDCARERLPGDLLRWLERAELSVSQLFEPLEITGEGGRSYLFRAAQIEPGHWLLASRESDSSILAQALEQVCRITAREAEVLLWLSRGKGNAEIAAILAISERTVAKHIESIFPKLCVENRKQALLRALEVIGPQ